MTTASLRPLLATFAFLVTTLHPIAAMAEIRMLSGTVTYRERIALPPAASVEVRLVDVSLADAPARTIAETTITPEGQVPIPYRLEYESSDIVPGRSYALQVRITAGDRPLFITQTRHPVFAGGADRTDIVVERVAGATTSPAGRWLAEDIRRGGVIDRLQTILEIAEDGTITGTGGCNRMSGKATITGDSITFGSIAATQRACTPAVMHQEAKFFAALQDVRTWRVDPTRQKLVLLDGAGNPLIVLAQH